MSSKVIITAALAGGGTFKANNPAVPYSPKEFADEAEKCFKAGASMLHIHARDEAKGGAQTSEVAKVKAVYDAIKQRVPDIIIQVTSSVGTPCPVGPFPAESDCVTLINQLIKLNMEARLRPIKAIKPESGSLNTNSMNFSVMDRKTGQIIYDNVLEMGCRPEAEIYDMGGLDNWLLIFKQGFFKKPYNFNFVWGVAGGQKFRPGAFAELVHALPADSNFTTCGVGIEQFPAIMQSCLMGGHMRVGLEDNTRLPNGELAKGSYEQVELAVKIASCIGREPATPAEARKILGIVR
ncbi:MAG: 3-keto-5-aminohexanoate cleavage protein [Chloroflexi bacterium]|nr:3-keto-5-aminohexanoate cleavage protein [Chloroflexota bacterium]